jgi:hypothetical protein
LKYKICPLKKIFILVVGFFFFYAAPSQINEQQIKQIQQIEKQLQPFADSIINAGEWLSRFRADSSLTQVFVQALKIKNSFYYHFDSLKTISQLYAPDSSFKIFTWQVMKDFSYYRQKGAIQMRTKDGSLKLFPLFDNSEFTENPADSVRNAQSWIGALYYRILLRQFNNKKYYTLLGSDANNARSNKKWIEVLWFNENNEPMFGGNFFNYPANDATKPKQPVARFCVEYNKEAVVRMDFDPQYNAIIFDHLVSTETDVNDKALLVPYGDYEGFRWKNGKWIWVDDPFEEVKK